MAKNIESPYTSMMKRLERVMQGLEEGTMEPTIGNAITSASRAWMGGIQTAIKVSKASCGEVKSLMEGK